MLSVVGLDRTQPFQFNLSLVLSSHADSKNYTPGFLANESFASSQVNYRNTIEWGGITAIVDSSNGEVIDGWSLKTDSGLQWDFASPVAAVPEPSSLGLMIVGAVALWGRRRTIQRLRLATT